jgi:pimeloyl-ACP methyl ester carboxylesterase
MPAAVGARQDALVVASGAPHGEGTVAAGSGRRIVPTYVLIHGGNYDSRCWRFVTPHLDGPAVLVDLPGRGRRPAPMGEVTFHDFVAAAVEDVEISNADDVVLVGHSAGGLTAAFVVNRIPDRIRAVVFVSSTIPPDGGAIVDSIDPEVRDAVLAGTGDGTYEIDGDTLRTILCNDLDAEMTAVALAETMPDTTAFLSAPVDLSGVKEHDRVVYVRCLQDQTLPLEQQDAAIAAIGVAQVVELDAGHMCMLSRPGELAAIIVDAGR